MATNDKYDRQLRLWGPDGQRHLMKSNILLIHANAVGSEVLKNLVLPGIKSFTILDDYCVDDVDLGSNFFTTSDSKGKPRAEVVAGLLSEMNPDDVVAEARVANFQNVLQTEHEYFSAFDLIIAANIPQIHLQPLADLCWSKNTPLLIVRSYGLVGSVRLQLRYHEVFDAREERDQHDLHLSRPFPELTQYCQSFDLASLDSLEHGHVPYPVLLWQAMRSWTASTAKERPTTFAEKESFKAVVRSMARDYHMEMNFEQAVKESYRAYATHELSSYLQELLADQTLQAGPSAFSCMVAALSRFVSRHDGCVPVSGSLPDMVSTTDNYVRLQQIYHRKAQADLQEFVQLTKEELLNAGHSDSFISEDDIQSFCRRAGSIALVQTRSLAEELLAVETTPSTKEATQDELYSDPAQTPIVWYVCLRAADLFYKSYFRYPGQLDSSLESDAEQLFTIMKDLWTQLGLPQELVASSACMETEGATFALTPAHAMEIVRFAAAELHNISAIIGGIASQEAAKVLTHQYLPINNTYVFNGIASCGACYEM